MVSLQRNWFPAMKLNCYNISVSCFTLNRILQSTSTSHHGSKSRTWLRCQHGIFWRCRMLWCLWWGDQKIIHQPWPCRRSTPSCRGIGWGYQGPRPTAWKMDFPDITMKLSTKSYMAYLRPRETINHPPIHCPKWPRSGCSIVSRRKISSICFQMRHTPFSYKK